MTSITRTLPTDAILIDVNHFHMLNDRYGKSYGDEMLKQDRRADAGNRQETGGIACRSEADTFLAYCPHRTDYDAILEQVSAYVTLYGAGAKPRPAPNGRLFQRGQDREIDIERRFDRAKMAADTVKGNSFAKTDRHL